MVERSNVAVLIYYPRGILKKSSVDMKCTYRSNIMLHAKVSAESKLFVTDEDPRGRNVSLKSVFAT